MKMVHRLILITALTFVSSQVMAFEVDDNSMNTPGKEQKFSDPDEKSPVFMTGAGNKPSGNTDNQSTVQYNYDPSAGTYVPATPDRK